MSQFDPLKLENQLCHPIYSAANALLRVYKPFLEPLGLTYPQYLILLSLWEQDGVPLTQISETTYFDSGTLTPLIKKLVDKGLIDLRQEGEDRRVKWAYLTRKGIHLKQKALSVPREVACLLPFPFKEAEQLVKMIRQLHQALLEYEAKTKV